MGLASSEQLVRLLVDQQASLSIYPEVWLSLAIQEGLASSVEDYCSDFSAMF